MANEEKLNKINEAASQRCSAALSKLISSQIEVVFSQPIITDVKEVSPLVGSQELGVGIYLPITGSVTGSALFLFPKETSFNLCDLTMKKESRTIRELSSPDEALLKEMGNILLGNYLAILSNDLKGEIIGGMPKFSFGMFGAILEEVITDFAKAQEYIYVARKVVKYALVIKIELKVKDMNMKGYLLLIFKLTEVEALLNAL